MSHRIVKPRLVRLDQTRVWHFGDLGLYVERVWEYFVYDANEATYACEMVASRWMEHVVTVAEIAPQTPSDKADEIERLVESWSGTDDSFYMHCYQADQMPRVDLDEVEINEWTDSLKELWDIVEVYRDRAHNLYIREVIEHA